MLSKPLPLLLLAVGVVPSSAHTELAVYPSVAEVGRLHDWLNGWNDSSDGNGETNSDGNYGETNDYRCWDAAVEATGLRNLLERSGPYTVFAPDDDAFKNRFTQTEWAVLTAGLTSGPGKEYLADLVKDHILWGIKIDNTTLMSRVWANPWPTPIYAYTMLGRRVEVSCADYYCHQITLRRDLPDGPGIPGIIRVWENEYMSNPVRRRVVQNVQALNGVVQILDKVMWCDPTCVAESSYNTPTTWSYMVPWSSGAHLGQKHYPSVAAVGQHHWELGEWNNTYQWDGSPTPPGVNMPRDRRCWDALVEASGLRATLTGVVPFTVFAPEEDEFWMKYTVKTWADLVTLSSMRGEMDRLVRYHIIQSLAALDDATIATAARQAGELAEFEQTTMQGSEIKIQCTATSVSNCSTVSLLAPDWPSRAEGNNNTFIKEAEISSADGTAWNGLVNGSTVAMKFGNILANNGVVHIINAVLTTPPLVIPPSVWVDVRGGVVAIDDSDGLTDMEIAGIVIGALVIIAVVLVLVYFLVLKDDEVDQSPHTDARKASEFRRKGEVEEEGNTLPFGKQGETAGLTS